MSDLISRSAIIAELQEMKTHAKYVSEKRYIRRLLYAVGHATAVDAVEVVRCKDCIHYEFCKDGVVETDFCSCGERREDG